MGMRLALVLGPDEAALGTVTIKDLRSGVQQSVPRQGAAQAVRKLLESPLPS
jgi:histidyl-tRNA synthetase